MLEATLGLATIIRSVEVTSVLDTFEVEAPFTLAATGAVPALVRQAPPGEGRSKTIPASTQADPSVRTGW
jgi:hypothetical protein